MNRLAVTDRSIQSQRRFRRVRSAVDIGARGPTTDQVWAILVWALPLIGVLLSRMPVGDLAYQISAGGLMVDSGHVLRTDPFTFTMGGQPWLDQQWGAQILLHLAYRVTGWEGLLMLRAAIVSVAFGITFMRSRRTSGDTLVAAVLTLGAVTVTFAMPGSVALRPQLLAVPLFLTSVEILRRRGEGTHVLAWLPLVTVVWANLHGSFLLAPLLCGIALVGDIARRRDVRSLALVTLACLLAAAVNPWGFAVYGYVFQLATATIVRTVIDEWQPLWRQFPAWPLVLLAGSFVGLMFATGRLRRPLFEEGLGLMTFGALAIASGRNLLWACLYAPPVLSGLILRKRERMPERSVIGVALVGTLVALVAIGIGRVATADPDESLLSEAPIGITEALGGASSSGGRVFDGWWGSWFEFALPHQQMFVDARAELFPDRVWNDFFAISTATGGWQHALDRWDIRIVVASYDHQERLITAIAADPGWLEIYRDQDGVIFQRVHDA